MIDIATLVSKASCKSVRRLLRCPQPLAATACGNEHRCMLGMQTGAMMISLGQAISGHFAASDEIADKIKTASANVGAHRRHFSAE